LKERGVSGFFTVPLKGFFLIREIGKSLRGDKKIGEPATLKLAAMPEMAGVPNRTAGGPESVDTGGARGMERDTLLRRHGGGEEKPSCRGNVSQGGCDVSGDPQV